MKTVHMKIEPNTPSAKRVGRVNTSKLDATTETQTAQHVTEDDAAAMQDAAKFARRVRRRLGFSQAEFATRMMCRWKPSATGNRVSAAQLELPRRCLKCWIKRLRRRWLLCTKPACRYPGLAEQITTHYFLVEAPSTVFALAKV
jgi:hypothetical protein